MLTRWAIALHNYDFTVKHVPGKLNVVPDMSRVFSGQRGTHPMRAQISRDLS